MDVVVEDYAIRSPLDALAAWRSTTALQEALTTALQNADSADLLRVHIQTALEIAPPGSAAECRALALHAILSPGRRRAFYSKAADAVIPTSAVAQHLPDEQVPFFIDSSTPVSARAEIATCLSCAEVLLKLEQEQDLAGAIEVLCNVRWPDLGTTCSGSAVLPTMLSVAPLYFVLTRLLQASRKASDCFSSDCEDNLHPLPQLDTLAQEVYHCLRAEATRLNLALGEDSKSHLTPALDALFRGWDVRISMQSSRRHSNASHDTGYGSLEEDVVQQDDLALNGAANAPEKSSTFHIRDADALAVSI